MDIVKGVRECPVVLQVVHFESHIWRHICREVCAQVDAQDLSGGIDVGEVDAPDAAAGADVEHAVRVVDGGQMQLAVVQNVHHSMH